MDSPRASVLLPLLACLACASAQREAGSSPPAAPPASVEEAHAFVSQVNARLYALDVKTAMAEWIKSTYITDDTERAAAAAQEEKLAYVGEAVREARRFDGLSVDAGTARALHLLRLSSPGPADPQRRLELTTLGARLTGLYGKGKWCGPDGKGPCRDLEELTQILAKSRDERALRDAWVGWRTVARPMRPLYRRFVELANEGARESGFHDLADLWRSRYDMPPEAFEQETDRLWEQVKPLYQALHCYVRTRLQKVYGRDVVKDAAPIPAHLLGNMWAQEWNNVYALVEPYPGIAAIDVTPAMQKQKWDWRRMVQTGEAFYVSMGLDPLPKTFWERSMFVKPRDREVICHASAWNVLIEDDLRIKMCIKVTQEDLQVIQHELGHDYYDHAYYKLPVLFHGGANDGFHEAIGDSLVLSMTPAYLRRIGLLDVVPTDHRGLIDVQMKDALTRIAFLPFGKLIDQWRWDVFSGKTRPEDYEKSWWVLREKIQGVASPVPRSEEDFDPGAKYHVPANVPYTRYFVARILQFQFHRSMCQAAGFRGPLHECSVFGSKAAGERLSAMLRLGQSKPWQDALEAMTGSRRLDAAPLLEYFAPLSEWLAEANRGQSCGY